MSLINQMLQDLDARKVAHGPGSGLPNDVRPLPRTQTSRLPIILGVIALLILVAAVAAYWQRKVALPDLPLAPVAIAPMPTVRPSPEPETTVPPPIPVTEKPSAAPPVIK